MRCPNCSEEADRNFCSNCGSSLSNSSVATMETSARQIPLIRPPSNKLAFKIGCGCLLAVFAFLFILGLIGSLIYPDSVDLSSRLTDDNDNPVSSIENPATTATSPKDPSGFIPATVMKIIDGDTIEVSVSKKLYRVRLIGVDTPEINDPRKSIQDFAKEASDYTTNSLSKKVVYLEYDTQNKDKYGRILAYVWLSKPEKTDDIHARAKMFNADLLLNGYAQTLTIPPNVKYADYFRDYQQEARAKKIGLWKKPTTTTIGQITTEKPNSTSLGQPTTSITIIGKTSAASPSTPPSGSATSSSSSEDVTVYITKTGSKYHRYGCRYLSRSCIPIKLSDAIKQGYTPCNVCGPPAE